MAVIAVLQGLHRSHAFHPTERVAGIAADGDDQGRAIPQRFETGIDHQPPGTQDEYVQDRLRHAHTLPVAA
jgi:hypothetical protein